MVIDDEVATGLFVGMDPATGIAAGVGDDGLSKPVLGWNPVQGDTYHWAPAGSVGGGGTRRHLFDREVYVDSDGLGAYVNVRAWGSITGAPTTVQGYGITNAVRNDTSGSITNSVAGTAVLTLSGLYAASGAVNLAVWQRSGGAVAARIRYDDAATNMRLGTSTAHDLILERGGSAIITLAAAAASFGVSALPSADNSVDLGSGSFRWRNLTIAGTLAAPTITATTVTTTGSIFSGDEFRFTNKSRLVSPSDGVLSFTNNAGNANASLTIAGLTATTGAFSGAVSGTTGTFSGAVAGTTGTFSGVASAASYKQSAASGQYYHFDLASGNNFLGASAANTLDLYAGGVQSMRWTASSIAHYLAALPASDNAVDVGSASFRWRVGYFMSVDATGGSGGWLVGGTAGKQRISYSTDIFTAINVGNAYASIAGLNLIAAGGVNAAITGANTTQICYNALYVVGTNTGTRGSWSLIVDTSNLSSPRTAIGVSNAGMVTMGWGLDMGNSGISSISSLTTAGLIHTGTSINLFNNGGNASMTWGKPAPAADNSFSLDITSSNAAYNFSIHHNTGTAGGSVFAIIPSTAAGGTSFTTPLFKLNGSTLVISFGGAILPITDNARDVGSGSFRWRDGYFSRDVVVGGSLTVGSFSLPAAGWTAGTMLNSWSGQVYYWKDPSGIVEVQSTQLIRNGGGATVIQLPVGYRPGSYMRFIYVSADFSGNSVVGWGDIDNATGNIILDNHTGYQNYTHFHIRFSTTF